MCTCVYVCMYVCVYVCTCVCFGETDVGGGGSGVGRIKVELIIGSPSAGGRGDVAVVRSGENLGGGVVGKAKEGGGKIDLSLQPEGGILCPVLACVSGEEGFCLRPVILTQLEGVDGGAEVGDVVGLVLGGEAHADATVVEVGGGRGQVDLEGDIPRGVQR